MQVVSILAWRPLAKAALQAPSLHLMDKLLTNCYSTMSRGLLPLKIPKEKKSSLRILTGWKAKSHISYFTYVSYNLEERENYAHERWSVCLSAWKLSFTWYIWESWYKRKVLPAVKMNKTMYKLKAELKRRLNRNSQPQSNAELPHILKKR